jgi:predicted porin
MLGLGYQFGEVPGAFNRNTTSSAGLAYNGGMFNVSGYYTHANVNDQSNNSWSIGGNILPIPMLRFNAGYFWYQADQGALGQRTDHAFTVSTRVSPLDKVSVEAGYQVLNVINAARNAGGSTLNPFGNATATGVAATGTGDKKTFYGSVFYHFDRRAEVYLAGDYMWLSGGYRLASTNGADNQTEIATGIRFRF